MNKKVVFGLTLAAISIVAAPAIAISQNQNDSFCDALNTLRHESVNALFVHFQGFDDLETATALLRETGPDGRLAPSVAIRFDAAARALAVDQIHEERQMRITRMESSPAARKCQSLQDSGILWASPEI